MADYETGMMQSAITADTASLDAALRQDLAQGDAMIRSIGPIMRHLLSSDQHSLFADEIVARVRGGAFDLASQLLDEVATAAGATERLEHPRRAFEDYVEALTQVPGLITHLHSLAIESQLAERLQDRLALDPVLPPLLQALLASTDAATAALAMNLLAAQARFMQAQRRMQAPLAELPADLLHGALMVMRGLCGGEAEEHARAAETAVRARYDESRTRLGIVARLVTAMGGGAVAALNLSHAGVAIFTSALSLCSTQDRDLVVLSTNEGQLARMALSLRAAGIKPVVIGEQMLALHPEVMLPEGFDGIGADRAAALLALSGPLTGD